MKLLSRNAAQTAFSRLLTVAIVACLVWPAIAFMKSCWLADSSPHAVAFPLRATGLFLRTTGLAALGALLCIILAFPIVPILARRVGSWPLTAIMSATLLCPPMILALGMKRIAPGSNLASLQCVASWAVWCWPISASLMALEWRRSLQPSFSAARLECSTFRAIVHVAVPGLARSIAVSFLALFAIFLGDYAVPHACNLQVYATELLSIADSSTNSRELLRASLPCLAMIALVFAIAHRIWKGAEREQTTEDQTTELSLCPYRRKHVILIVIYSLLSFGPAFVAFVGNLSASAFGEAWTLYRDDLSATIAVAGVGSILAAVAAIHLTNAPRTAGWVLLIALCWMAVPGALVGQALVIAFNRNETAWIYDHWPILSIGYFIRFGWIALAVARAAQSGIDQSLLDAAIVDGASHRQLHRHIVTPLSLPAIVAASIAIIALSISDVAASSLLRVPSYNPIAHVIIEKFHRFEDDMLISLCLWLFAIAAGLSLILTSLASKAVGRIAIARAGQR